MDPPGPVFEAGTNVSVTITPETGYAFCGWTGGLTGSALTGNVEIGTADITLDAAIEPRWAALIHIAVDNNIDFAFESQDGIVTNYLQTLEAVKAADSYNVMDLYVMMDAYDESDPRETGYETTFIDGYYKLTGGAFADDLEEATGEINSGSLAQTKAFVDFALADTHSLRTFYSVFNHGGGFDDQNVTATYGIGFDDSDNGDALSHRELADATAYIKAGTGRSIDVFFPYACLMGGVELAWEIRESADVLIASEEVFPAETWSWEALDAIIDKPSIESRDVGEAFCESALDYFGGDAHPRTFTLATVDLSKIQPLYDALGSFATAATAWIGTDADRAALFNAAASSAIPMYTPYYNDIGEFMDRVDANAEIGSTVKATIPAVHAAISGAVTCFTTNFAEGDLFDHEEATGLSVFHALWVAENYGYYYNPATYGAILAFGATNPWADYAAKLDALKVIPIPEDWDEYEPDDDETSTNVLERGIANKQHHTLSVAGSYGDFDTMIVHLTAGTTYTFETGAGTEGADTYMMLINSEYEMLADHDDIDYDAGNYYAKLTYTPNVTASYYLVINDRWVCYGDYWVWYDEGTWGIYDRPQYRKWAPSREGSQSLWKR